MARDQEQKNSLRILGEEILRALETLVLKATQHLDVLRIPPRPTFSRSMPIP